MEFQNHKAVLLVVKLLRNEMLVIVKSAGIFRLCSQNINVIVGGFISSSGNCLSSVKIMMHCKFILLYPY